MWQLGSIGHSTSLLTRVCHFFIIEVPCKTGWWTVLHIGFAGSFLFWPALSREAGSKLRSMWTPSRSIWGTVTRHKGSQNVLRDISLQIMGLVVLGVKSISAIGQFRYQQPIKRAWFHAEDMALLTSVRIIIVNYHHPCTDHTVLALVLSNKT